MASSFCIAVSKKDSTWSTRDSDPPPFDVRTHGSGSIITWEIRIFLVTGEQWKFSQLSRFKTCLKKLACWDGNPENAHFKDRSLGIFYLNQFNWKTYVFKYYFIPENGVAMHCGNCLCNEVVQAGEECGGRVGIQAVHLGQDITTQGTLIISSRTLARR